MHPLIADVGRGPTAVAVDVGGTMVKSAIVDGAGAVRACSPRPTPRSVDTAAAVVELVAEMFHEARRTASDSWPIALSVAVPGIVDEQAGVGVYSENLGWRDRPLRRMLEERVDAPVTLVHDVRSAGTAEARIGAAAGVEDSVTVAIGTGVSAALWSGGRMIRGRGYAGELGHLRVTSDDVPCVCGGRGCLEAVASAAAIVRRYSLLGGGALVAGAQDVIGRASLGDDVALRVWEDALDGLSVGLASVAGILAPEVVVLAGGLSLAGDALIQPVKARLEERVCVVPLPRVVVARFAADAGTVGAALSTRPMSGSADLGTREQAAS